MQQIPFPINEEIASYILHNKNHQTRFDIDRVLLKRGYNAVDIEAAWSAIFQLPKGVPKPGLVNYIMRKQASLSHQEIDDNLLSSGHDSFEIEVAWLAVEGKLEEPEPILSKAQLATYSRVGTILKIIISLLSIWIALWQIYSAIGGLKVRNGAYFEILILATILIVSLLAAAFLIFKKPFAAGILLIIAALIFIAGLYTLIFPGIPILVAGLTALMLGKRADLFKSS